MLRLTQRLRYHTRLPPCLVCAGSQIKWAEMDFDASWLQPARLLLFLQLNCSTGRSGACDDKMPARLTVDGAVVEGLKAYESRCTVRGRHSSVHKGNLTNQIVSLSRQTALSIARGAAGRLTVCEMCDRNARTSTTRSNRARRCDSTDGIGTCRTRCRRTSQPR
jgi:hypothetical protein